MVNEELIRLIVKQIEDTPEHWDQAGWARSTELGIGEPVCRTTFCFAGWAAFMTDMVDGWGRMTDAGRRYMQSKKQSSGPHQIFDFDTYAQEVLGLDGFQSSAIFSSRADDNEDWYLDDEDYNPSPGQRIRQMKETIFKATGIDIP